MFKMSQNGRVTIALGIDLGSTTVKVALVEVDETVRVLRIGRVATPDDAPALLDATAELVRACIAASPGHIAAVGIASMAETGVPLDAEGHPLTGLQRWDRATGDHLASVLARHPDLPGRTGIPVTPKPTLVTLLRLREEQPDVFRRLAKWQGVADLVASALTGSHATDHTLAARTMLLDGRERRWNAALLAEIGVADGILPQILAPGEPAGTTRGSAGFGLPDGIPVHIAGHDHAVGAWAAGVRAPGAVADSLGTAEAVLAVTDTAHASAVEDGFSVGRTVDDRHDTILGGSSACGALLAQWPGSIVDALAAEDAGRWRTSPVTVLPYPRGRQCPAPDPAARLRILGEARKDGDLERGVLQSLVLQSRWMRAAIAGHAGRTADAVTLLGSLTDRIPAWAPLSAATAAVPVRRCATAEPGAAGAALLAAVRAGRAPESVALDTASVVPAVADGLDEAYRRFLDAALVRHPDPSEGET
jgi:xylulokinase